MVNNVQFCIYPVTYSTAYKRDVVSDVPSVRRVPGRLHSVIPSLESEIANGTDKDRTIRFRVLVNRTKALETLLKSGAVIEVTHRRDERTNTWREKTTGEQYIVQTDTEVFAVGAQINLGLIRKDKS